MEFRSGIYDVVVLGAGGAGLMCAAVAGRYGKRVLLIDHANEPGRKILISGGGRCNFTNIHTTAENFLSANPHFAKSALGRYQPQDFIDMVRRHGIAWHEKTLGQLFCDGSAKNIVAMLLEECAKSRIEIRLECAPGAVRHDGMQFRIDTNAGTLRAKTLVVATGGPSIPKLGATGYAYDLARQFGLKVVEPRPALVPLTLGPDEALFKELSGVSTPVIARCGKTRFDEAALFTHKGMSGPAILQISSYWRHGEAVGIDFLPGHNRDWLCEAKRNTPRANLRKALSAHLPERLADTLAEKIGYQGELANIPDKALGNVADSLADWQFHPNGTEGFKKAEVTIGGVSTAELSSKTMEAKKVPGLYFIGECVDVTGWLGGYNFQWAWASGHAAGTALQHSTSDCE